ncbi:tetratricopeptide repeat protein [Salinispira pacifica]|uniref:TPR domain protein, putative component of TonB system n=1 Tax=Salinispira pacifica TaxID=1307761 RepID=V5WD03_9SPIO|nr:tetratricopeptide repeat protein [Salinispira pacifica]AHC13698.1 TPR domain protein, putative component of TonB system [Salinispira pacifica]
MNLFPLLIAGIAVLLLSLVAVMIFTRTGGDGEEKPAKKKKTKNRDQQIREANKRLASNPKDHEALSTIADIYFNDQEWEKAHRSYAMLIEMASSHPEIDEKTVNLRYALSAYHLGMMEEAYKGLLLARTFDSELFEINYHLGVIEYKRKNYEKSAGYLNNAVKTNPEHLDSNKYLGLSLFRLKRLNDSVTKLRTVVTERPDEKESLYFLAQGYYELGQSDKSVKIFEQLRPDPVFGPHAAIMAGSIHLKMEQLDKAQMDFEIGLRHEKIKPELRLELKYRLAAALMKQQLVSDALAHLQDIYKANPDYKDVAAQIKRSSELSQNEHLQTYLMANDADFVALCRRLSAMFFRNANTKITDIQVRKGEYADILAEVETSTWADIVLFRFVRTTGVVGEFVLRDLHSRIKETKAGRGFCICAGSFSETAQSFVEARFIDLVDKPGLLKSMQRLSRKTRM